MPRARHRVTGHEFDFSDAEWPAYQRNGWQEIDENGEIPEGTEPSPLAHADQVLADVDGDPVKAGAALEAEAGNDTATPELLAELERIAALDLEQPVDEPVDDTVDDDTED